MLVPILISLGTLGALGGIFGLILGFAAKKLSSGQKDLSEEVREVLPGANCGGCGFVGCDDYAKAIAEGRAKPNLCGVGGAETALMIANILGVDVHTEERQVAFVACQGNCDNAPAQAVYTGEADCATAMLLPGGSFKACKSGCLGYGTCVKACAFGAISVVNGVAVVDDTKCTGCGACSKACPKGLIHMVPASSYVRVACSNPNSLKDVVAVCKAGCITCNQCVKNCPQETISMVNNIPVINYELCIACGICSEVCKRNVIVHH